MGGALPQVRAELGARFEGALEIRNKPERAPIPTGIPAIDRIAAGGAPRGAITEICGPDSSGRTSLLYAILGEAARGGDCCAWIDAAGAFDPASAAEAGVDLGRVLWVNCGGNTEHALKALDLVLQAGGFGLVALDLADTPEREAGRISLASWFRLRHAAEQTGAALVVAARRINARSCSALQLELRRGEAIWRGRLLRGMATRAESRKRYQSRTAEFTAVW